MRRTRHTTLLAIAVASSAAATSACTGEIDMPAGEVVPDAPSQETAKHVDIEGPAVLGHVQHFADLVCGTFDACTISTYEGHQPVASRAIDILVSDAYGRVPSDDNMLGNAVADFALAHQPPSGITYVIFRQRINSGSGWRPMEDRGSITQNHYDHVHVSFEPTAP